MRKSSMLFMSGTLACFLHFTASTAQVDFNFRQIDNFIGHTMVSDIDGDGRNDLVLHEHTDPFHIKVDGRKPRISWFSYPDYTNYTVAFGNFMGDRFAVGDINSDRSADIVSAVASDSDYEGPKEIFWYENPAPAGSPKENQSWSGHLIGSHEGAVKDIKAGDMDGNGKLDIVIRSHDFTSLFFQLDKSWVTRRIAHQRKEGLDLEDMDLDGDLDVILNGFWFETPADPIKDEFVFHNIDEKWYTQNSGIWQDNNCYVGAADLNQDGIPDIILSHSEKEGYPLSWYSVASIEKVKTGPWQEQRIAEVFDWCETVDIGDVDNDGTLDVMAAKFRRHDKPGTGTYNLPPYPISIFYNKQGDGSVWTRQDIDQEGIYAGSLGDLGSDGDLDIVGPLSYFTAPIRIWENKTSDHKLSLNSWSYLQVDNSRERITDKEFPNGLKTFGLDMSDVTQDGLKDIVAGRYVYRNPGGDMTGPWRRTDLGSQYDGVLFVDVDDDKYGDIIAQHFPGVYWLEAEDTGGQSWTAREIGTLPRTGHVNGQGHEISQIVPGGKPEILIATEEGLFYFEIPKNPAKDPWPKKKVTSGTMDEGFGTGDIDGDGYTDIALGKVYGEEKARGVVWYKNPGGGTSEWMEYPVTTTSYHPDRIRIADMNADGLPDVVISEERWPGKEPDASLYWVEQDVDRNAMVWKIHTIVTQFTMNNLDVADVDRDGDLDILQGGSWATNEVWWWENPYPVFEVKKAWKRHFIKNEGEKQHHDQLFIDLDGDQKAELVFWNQRARTLVYARIPADPAKQPDWMFNTIWTWPQEFKYEGQDRFRANKIDDYGSSRSAAADIIKGGHPEVVLGSGDAVGPLNLYEWNGKEWLKTTLIDVVDNGHTLQVGDINGDGNQDIYAAEMYRPGAGEECRQWVLYGNGKGRFDIQVISVGIGTHEGKLGDLDGDGDLDILQKDFQETRRVDVWFSTGVK